MHPVHGLKYVRQAVRHCRHVSLRKDERFKSGSAKLQTGLVVVCGVQSDTHILGSLGVNEEDSPEQDSRKAAGEGQ